MFRVTAPVLPDDSPVGETPDGLRLLFALRDGGTVRGPALNGEILHKGGDWMRVRPDGMGVCAIDALIRPDDGGVVLSSTPGSSTSARTATRRLRAAAVRRARPCALRRAT